MNIIVAGSNRFRCENVYFICKTCGCIFKAGNGEYKKHQNQSENKVWYSCDCPNCATEIISDESEEAVSDRDFNVKCYSLNQDKTGGSLGLALSVEEAINELQVVKICYVGNQKQIKAIEMAILAIKRVQWEDTLWHDAKNDPPKSPGLYYGKQDDTNSMYAVNYRDGVWTLDCYPDHKMDILQWAEYAAFRRDEDDE